MKNLSIKEIKEKVIKKEINLNNLIEIYQFTKKKGIKNLFINELKKEIKNMQLINKYNLMNSFENQYLTKGYKLICGIDEVGRGPLAGPVVSAAVIINPNKKIYGVDDSKKLSYKKREELFKQIINNAIAYNYSFVSNSVIDDINILNATKLSMQEAISNLKIKPDILFIDSESIKSDISQISIVKGDEKSNAIAQASIIAKVIRDRFMIKMHDIYPAYSFNENKGYGTNKHIEAIKKYGLTKIHRKSFLDKYI